MAKLKTFLSAEEIDKINTELGKKISEDYARLLKPGQELMVIVTLKGAAFFAADLMRKLTVPLQIDFVRLASYGSGTKSSGNVRILKDVETPPTGQHVLVLDEIVDSGRTLTFLTERLKASNPLSLKLCALLSKPSRREVEIDVDYIGREVEDAFLVGYGLDFSERYRNYKDISILDSNS